MDHLRSCTSGRLLYSPTDGDPSLQTLSRTHDALAILISALGAVCVHPHIASGIPYPSASLTKCLFLRSRAILQSFSPIGKVHYERTQLSCYMTWSNNCVFIFSCAISSSAEADVSHYAVRMG
jgi:hypothetical protein